jgi:hypothetical protein
MQRTLASLLVALAASVLAIAAAYIVGQRSAEFRLREDVARSEERQRAMVDELRRELAPRTPGEPSMPVTRVAAPLATPEPVQSAPEPEPAPVKEPEQVNSEAPPAEAVVPEAASVQAVVTQTPSDAVVENPISREQFDAVGLGASYADAVTKLGRDGRIAMTMNDASGSQTTQYVWQWSGASGESGRILMRFEDGKLKDKKFSE